MLYPLSYEGLTLRGRPMLPLGAGAPSHVSATLRFGPWMCVNIFALRLPRRSAARASARRAKSDPPPNHPTPATTPDQPLTEKYGAKGFLRGLVSLRGTGHC